MNLRKLCLHCKKHSHESNERFCLICASALHSGVTNTFYSELNIPDDTIGIEERQEGTFLGFPFFLRKCEYNRIRVVLLDQYPLCIHTVHYLKKGGGEASTKITITAEYLDELLKEGFVWFHHTEMDTLW